MLVLNSRNAILFSFSASTSPCYWDPEVTRRVIGALTLIFWHWYATQTGKTTTLSHLEVVLSVMHESLQQPPLRSLHETIGGCDCPCDDFVDVQRPEMSMMTLSYIAQAIVVTIVGFNMGFRFVQSWREREGIGCKVRVRESVGLRVRFRGSVKDSGSRMHVSFFMVEGEGWKDEL